MTTPPHKQIPTLRSTVRRRDNLLSADVGDEAVIMSIEHGEYFACNEVAKDIWNLIANPVTVGALASRLAAIYEGDADEMRQDVIQLLSELVSLGLVDIAE